MKTKHLSLLVAAGFVAAMAGAVRADDKPKHDTMKSKTSAGDVQYEGVFNGSRGSKLIGADVKNNAGKDLGEIKDIVVDPQSGRVAYAVLQFGGFLGMGDKLFAIPWHSLTIESNDLVKLDIDKSQLKESTGFDQDHWPNMADQKWATETHRRFNQKPYWETGVNEVGVNTGNADNSMNNERVRALPVCKLSDIIGHDIENNMDKDLGDINDVVLDSNRGQIAYAVLGVGGFIGIGEDLVAVPWDKLDVRIANDDTTVRLAMTEKELKDGPHFSKDKWPNADDKDYMIRVYTYYDAEPYWQMGNNRVSSARNP
ncbi:MAG TPA: PRC-barrel domain-containing protein [Phycisphaerae bacterium]|nr:PRC-barrel domain-containing protein [Phycisphaerae bacterium]